MRRNSALALLLIAVAITPFLHAQTARPEPKREHFQNAAVLYGWTEDNIPSGKVFGTIRPTASTVVPPRSISSYKP